MIKRIILSIFLLTVCTISFAQTTRYLRGGREISSNMVNNIFQDRDGIVWISTENGLNRHDGTRNTVLYYKEDNNSHFTAFFEDSKGRKFACSSDHIMLYDSDTEKMTPIPTIVNGKESNVRAANIIQLKDHRIIAFTSGYGIMQLDESNEDSLVFRQNHSHIPYYNISELIEDSKGYIWAATENGIVCWDGKKLHHVTCPDPAVERRISAIAEDPDGVIWCTSRLGGVWKVDRKSMSISQLHALSNLPINCLLAKEKGELLLGTNGKGVFTINTKTDEAKPFTFQAAFYASSNLNIHHMIRDKEGNLWVACYQRGVTVLRHRESRFGYYGHYSPTADVIGNNCANALSFSNGLLWVGADGDGLYALRPTASDMEVPQTRHFTQADGVPSNIVALHHDKRGKLWIGTWMQGLYVMDTATGKCSKVTNIPSKNPESVSIFCFAEDGRGNLWLGSMGDGIFAYNLATGDITAGPNSKDGVLYDEKQNIIINRWVNALHMGSNGILYIATSDGLSAMDVKTRNCLKAFNGKNRILSGISVNTVNQSNDGLLWIGSAKGLMCYNPKDESIKTYTHEDGIDGNSVLSIVNDGKGTLWLSTNLGITSYNIKEDKFFNYSSQNGMHGNEFVRNASHLASDGMIYFGGTEGVSCFRPGQVREIIEKPVILITGLFLNGKPVNTTTMSGRYEILKTNILHANRIDLAADDNDFTLELSTLNFVQAECVQYEYRIDDGDWVVLPVASKNISFNNLESGTHHLEVRAKEWESYSDVKILEIVIHPHWYLTWWAYLIYLSLIIIAVNAALSYIHTRHEASLNRLRLEQQEQISEAKLQFFMNISHEIRTPMTLIFSPLQRLIQTDKDEKRQSAYKLMHRNVERIMQLVNQLLDVRKIDKGQMKLHYRELDIVPYVTQVVDGFKDLCETKNIEISFESAKESLNVWIDALNFDKIIINLLSNAFKYTPKGGHINVNIDTAKDTYYIIKVKDDGKGLSNDALHHVFDRFYQQSSEVNNTVQGSGVGLNLTRSLVQMHHGEISVANNEDGPGCTFTIVLPLGRAHIKDDEIDTREPEEKKEELVEIPAAEAQKLLVALTEEKRPLGPRKSLLVVEDDQEIQAYLTAEMASSFNVTCVNNGEEALQHIRKSTPDIIISDVMMPVMDGLTLLRHIRQNTTMNSIPVILLTAKSSEQDNIEGISEGADAYITKPFNIELLRRTALNLVQRQQQLRNIYDGRQTPQVDKVEMTTPDQRLMQRIMKVINTNLDNPDLGNELITSEVGISRVHLYRKLKEMTNLSLRDFIKNIRLTEAARLLSENHHSISEVATRTGFENVSYFTVVFKQKYGMSPSAYMNEHNKANGEQQATDSDKGSAENA